MKRFVKILLVLLMVFSGVAVSAEITRPNASTHKRTNAQTPTRIVSLKPNITELLFAIGAGDRVVGVTTWCNKPDAAKKLPKIADYIKPNIEKILALEPDLVIGSEENSIKEPIRVMERSGIKTLLLQFKTLDDFYRSTIKLGEAVGHSDKASELVNNLKITIEQPATNNRTQDPRPKTLIVVGKRPLVAAGSGTFLGELVEIAGGKNIIDGKISYPSINMETVIAKDPDVILDLSMGSEASSSKLVASSSLDTGPGSWVLGLGSEVFTTAPLYWQGYPLKAVKHGRVHTLNISNFRAGPELAERVKELTTLLCKERGRGRMN